MRIADNMLYGQVNSSVEKNRTEMADLQNQAATQKRVTKPSDDPVAASRVLGARVDLVGQHQYLKNLNYAKSFLDFTDQTLGEMTENLMRVKELAISQAGDAGANEETRRVAASEVLQIFDSMVSAGNRKLGDRFIFGGYKTQRAPFLKDGSYRGDAGEMLIHTDKTAFLPMNVPGGQVLLGQGLSADGIMKPQMKQAATIEEFVQQRKSQEPKLTTPPQTPGTPAPVQPGQEKIEMRQPAAVGELQIEDVQPDDEVSGGINIFKVLTDLEVGLRTNDKATIQDTLDELDQAISQVVLARSQVGSRVTALNNLFESLQKGKVDTQGMISNQEDADVFKVVSDINQKEGTLQATMQTSSKLMQHSLLDFLR